MKTLKLFAVFVMIKVISCQNILYLNGVASPSHHLWNGVLIGGLAKKGLNKTIVSFDEDEKPPSNVHYIVLESSYD